MNKTVVVVLIVAALAALTTGVALAQNPQPPTPGGGFGPGGRMGMMRSFGATPEMGAIHEYMEEAMADALGISRDEFEKRHDAGETGYAIALDLGFSADEIPSLMREARVAAWEAAAKDGAVTQEQAEWMKSRPYGMGSGNCGGAGVGFGSGMRGWRFQQSNP